MRWLSRRTSLPLPAASALCSLPSALIYLLPVLLTQDSARAQADSIARGRALVLPVVGYSEVTGVQYGATAFRSHRTGANPETRASTEALYVAHTVKGHTKANARIERWSADNALQTRLLMDYRSYPLPYFGIGPATPEHAEEWYSSGVLTAGVDAQQAVRWSVYAMAGVRVLHTHVRKFDQEGALAAGVVDGSSGGTVSELRGGLAYDTRDHPVAPGDGSWMRVLFTAASSTWGSDFTFTRLTIDARRYTTLGSDFQLAMHAQVDGVDGTVPFDQLPMIGADSAMRGYDLGRYRDRAAATAQVEVRTPHWGRAGLVLFAGGGTVNSDFSRLVSGPWYPTVGAGLRLLLSPADRSTLRLDLAFGRGTVGANVGVGEAF